jgi:hypothetical protein
LSLYTETFTDGIFDNTVSDVNGLKLNFTSISEKCNSVSTSNGANFYKNVIKILKDGLHLSFVKYHAYQAGAYSLTIDDGSAISVVSNGNEWITFTLPTPLNLTKGVSYTFIITPPLNDNLIYVSDSNFVGTYWSSTESRIGNSISYTIPMELGFINSIGSYISVNPFSLIDLQTEITANWQYTIPNGTTIDIQAAVSTSNTIIPTSWVNITNNQIIKDVLFTMDLSNKYLWLKYNLNAQSVTESPILSSLTINNYLPTGAEIYFNKTEENWIGVIPVIGLINEPTITNGRVKVISGYGDTFYFPLSYDNIRNRFYGLVFIDSLWENKAKPNINALSITMETSQTNDFSTITKISTTNSFPLYSIFRRTSRDGGYTNTQFNPVWDGTKWQYSIKNFGVFTESITKNNSAIPIKFHPITSQITIKNVTINNLLIPNGNGFDTGSFWWWDNTKHTLYVQLDTVSNLIRDENYLSFCSYIGVEFESDTDIFGTRYDVIETTNIAPRIFYNGLILANNYYCTSIMGDNGQGTAGKQVDTHVRKTGTAEPIVIDCMERVAVHVDDKVLCLSDDTPYPANIIWKGDWQNYINSENNYEIIIKTVSDPSKWEQQKRTGISAERIISIRSNSRMGKQDYKLTNYGASIHKFPFVWGKEPWAGYDKQTNDRGIYSGDIILTNQVDCVKDITTLTNKWMLHYDSVKYVGMGIMFPQINTGKVYFVRSAPIYKDPPGAVYPIPVNVQSGTDVDSMFLETIFDSVQPNESVYISFYQGQYSGNSFVDLYKKIDDDYSTLFPTQTVVTGQTLRNITGGLNGFISFDLKQSFYMQNLYNFALKQVLYQMFSQSYDSKQRIFDTSNINVDSNQLIYRIINEMYNTLQQLVESGIIGSSQFDIHLEMYSNNSTSITMKQILYKDDLTYFDSKQNIFTTGLNEFALKQAIYKASQKQNDLDLIVYVNNTTNLDLLQQFFKNNNLNFDTFQNIYNIDKQIIGTLRLKGNQTLNIYLKGSV